MALSGWVLKRFAKKFVMNIPAAFTGIGGCYDVEKRDEKHFYVHTKVPLAIA